MKRFLMNQRRIWQKAAMVFLLLYVFGCTAEAEDQEPYRQVVNDCASFVIWGDSCSAVYDEVLERIGDYLENPETEALETTENYVLSVFHVFSREYESLSPYVMDEEFSEALISCGIQPDAYVLWASEPAGDLYRYLNSLISFEYYLMCDRIDDYSHDELVYKYESCCRQQEYYRIYNYNAINYWFAAWDADKTEYVKQFLVDPLASYGTGNGEKVWETDREIVEAKMTAALDALEELKNDYVRQIGTQEEELDEMKEALKE